MKSEVLYAKVIGEGGLILSVPLISAEFTKYASAKNATVYGQGAATVIRLRDISERRRRE